jgi:hypothetical protein
MGRVMEIPENIFLPGKNCRNTIDLIDNNINTEKIPRGVISDEYFIVSLFQ